MRAREEMEKPILKANERADSNVPGVDHGATTSLILDRSQPACQPRQTARKSSARSSPARWRAKSRVEMAGVKRS